MLAPASTNQHCPTGCRGWEPVASAWAESLSTGRPTWQAAEGFDEVGNYRTEGLLVARDRLHIVSSQLGRRRDEACYIRPVVNNAAKEKTRVANVQAYAEFKDEVARTL